MKKINESYKNGYLKTGSIGCNDNYVFINCPEWFMEEVEDIVSHDENHTISCVIKFTREDECGLLRTLLQCKQAYHLKIFCRTFVLSRLMLELMKKKGLQEFNEIKLVSLEKGIKALTDGDYEKSRIYYSCDCPSILDFKELVKQSGKVEFNVFICDLQEIDIQQALNNFIGARESYAIKLFTAKDKLNIYYDQVGNLIQSPHDFRLIDASKMIEDSDDCENDDE